MATRSGAPWRQLRTLDSYQFTGWYFTGYTGLGTAQSLAGTQRQVPTPALDTVAHADTGQDTGNDTNEGVDGHYIRINDDIWVNTLDPDFFYHYDADTSPELVAQYEPYAVATHIANATGVQLQYQPVGAETVNGIESMHYGLSEADRADLIQKSGLDPREWAGDVWLATNGGYLVKLEFGPVFEGETTPGEGWRWDTTAINCACPVNPPTNTASP